MKKASLLVIAALALSVVPAVARSGGSGGAETIKVSKCYSTFSSYCQLLIKASSSNTSAHLYAYDQNGVYIGEVQNGGGSRYGGSTFLTPQPPVTITIVSSSGAQVTVTPTPFQV